MSRTTSAASVLPIRVGNDAFCFEVDPAWTKLAASWEHGEAVGVACDSAGRVFVFVRGPRPVLVFDAAAQFLFSWGEGFFDRPHGIFIGPDDTVYCTDDCGHSVHAFSPEGQLRFSLGTPGRPSDTGATSIDYRTIKHSGLPFHFPTNLALGPVGEMYVSDGYGNARIHKFTPDGRLVHSWGDPGNGPSQFHVPHGIAVDRQGIVYVADRENSRIQLFTGEGKFLRAWTDVARPCQIYIERTEWLYVAELGFRAGRWPGTGPAPADATGGRVSIFDRAGALHARWGGGDQPCAPGDFFAPHGIWVNARGDLYVTEVILSGGGRDGLVPPTCHTLQKFVRRPSSAERLTNR